MTEPRNWCKCFPKKLVTSSSLLAFLAIFAIVPNVTLQDREVLNGQGKAANAAMRTVDKIRSLKDNQKRQLDSLGGGYLGNEKRQLDSLGGGYLGQQKKTT